MKVAEKEILGLLKESLDKVYNQASADKDKKDKSKK